MQRSIEGGAVALLAPGAVLALALALAGPAEAQGRPNTANLTCAQANALVQQRGVVVMSIGPPQIYRRFVANRGFCDRGDDLRPVFAPTTDDPECPVKWECVRRVRPNR